MIEVIGYLSTILLGFCGIPQAIKAWKTQSARDISWIFLLMWGGGEICATIYVAGDNLLRQEWQIPLLANYILNFIIIAFIAHIKFAHKG